MLHSARCDSLGDSVRCKPSLTENVTVVKRYTVAQLEVFIRLSIQPDSRNLISMTRFDPSLHQTALVIGAGLGGLAAAMRLGAKGYRVTVLDRLDTPGGRGSALTVDGHRFDLGPTIVTVPQVFRELWTACGRDFDADVDLRALSPFYEIRWPDGSSFKAHQDTDKMRAEIARL